MRISCIRCKHPHDSTVTPFMHDNIRLREPNPNPSIFYNAAAGFFECENCGTRNKVQVIWGLEKGHKMDNGEELEWAKANKYKRAITDTGKVHYVTTGGWQDGKVDPFCNSISSAGDYWGKKWKLTDKPVTCKNCLSKMRKEIQNDKLKDTG